MARIGTDTISLKEFEQDFGNKKLLDQLKSSSLETRNIHLEKMINNKLIVLAGYEEGFDQDEIIKDKVAKEQKKQLYLAAIQDDIYDKLIPEEDVKEYYKYLDEKRRVSRIFLRFAHLNNPKDVENVKQKAWQLYNRIKKGEDFAKLAKKYSQDQNTASKGGDIGNIKWGTSKLTKKMQRIVFNLQLGKVSEPIKTQTGFHIFKLTEKKVYYKPDYDDARFRMQRLLTDRTIRKEFEDFFKTYYDTLKQKYAVTYNEENIGCFAEKLAASKEQTGPASPGKRRFYLITEEDKKLPLITFNNGSITVREHITTVTKRHPPYNYPAQYYVDQTKERMDTMLRRKLLTYHASQKALQDTHLFQKKLKMFKDDLLIRGFENKHVVNEVNKHAANFEERRELARHIGEELIIKLKEKYKVKINKKVLRKAYSEF